MKQEKQLKPGTRVRLTGWSKWKSILNEGAFSSRGYSFPHFGTVSKLGVVLDGGEACWSLSIFTYEILADGNG